MADKAIIQEIINKIEKIKNDLNSLLNKERKKLTIPNMAVKMSKLIIKPGTGSFIANIRVRESSPDAKILLLFFKYNVKKISQGRKPINFKMSNLPIKK